MEQLGEPEQAPAEIDVHAEIEVRQHMLPDGYFPTKLQLFAAIMDIKINPPESSE